MMPTVRSLRHDYPHLFYPQTWCDREAFMDTPLPSTSRGWPSEVLMSYAPADGADLPLAIELLWLYIQRPDAPMWGRYLWCADTDHLGQRVYIGCNGKGMELHRHLHLTTRWGIPVWA